MATRKSSTATTTKRATTATKNAKATATKATAKAKDTVSDVIEDATEYTNNIFAKAKKEVETVIGKGKEMSQEASEKMNNAIKNLSVKKTFEDIKVTAKNANDFTVETAEEIVEGVVAGGEKWQKLTKKAIDEGFGLASKQQEIVFYALETAKSQATDSYKRAKSLFSYN